MAAEKNHSKLPNVMCSEDRGIVFLDFCKLR